MAALVDGDPVGVATYLPALGDLYAAGPESATRHGDAIAGVHLIRTAGGTVTDISGDPWHNDSQRLVVSNGEAHETVREVLQGPIVEGDD